MNLSGSYSRCRLVSLCADGDLFNCVRDLSAQGIHCCTPVPLIGGVICHCDEAGVRAVKAHPDVTIVEDDVPVRLVGTQVTRRVQRRTEFIPDNIWRVRAPQAWAATQAQDVRVAIVDTGIDLQHPDLIANIAGGINLVKAGAIPRDDNGHGTHVAGIAAAVHNRIGVAGVAPSARLYAVKVLDASGSGQLSNVILGLQWTVDQGMDVVNMSLGLPVDVQAFRTAIRNAAASGLTIVAAAGNLGGTNSVIYPAKYPEVIAVSAVTTEGKIASFSSTGPEVDVAAPGVNILSTLPARRYGRMSGTSMASPHVTGAAALYLSLVPTATPVQVRAIVAATSVVLPGLTEEQQGSGMVDALNIVRAAARTRSGPKEEQGDDVSGPTVG